MFMRRAGITVGDRTKERWQTVNIHVRSDDSPIFIVGRQHSGNTMLGRVLAEVPSVYALTGEGRFFDLEHVVDRMPVAARSRRVVELVSQGADPPLDETVQGWLLDQLENIPFSRRLNAGALYSCAMRYLTENMGATQWAQKATSYIFYVEPILSSFPKGKLIFLERNPLDIAASMKTRGADRREITRMYYGWVNGSHRAKYYAKRCPDNFLYVRYEDFVTEPEGAGARIFDFLHLPFDPKYLAIPHVNRSETPYNRDSESRGIDPSRVYHHRNILDVEERCLAAGVLSSEDLAGYPEVAREARVDRAWLSTWLRARGLLLSSLVRREGHLFMINPRYAVSRIQRRLFFRSFSRVAPAEAPGRDRAGDTLPPRPDRGRPSD